MARPPGLSLAAYPHHVIQAPQESAADLSGPSFIKVWCQLSVWLHTGLEVKGQVLQSNIEGHLKAAADGTMMGLPVGTARDDVLIRVITRNRLHFSRNFGPPQSCNHTPGPRMRRASGSYSQGIAVALVRTRHSQVGFFS